MNSQWWCTRVISLHSATPGLSIAGTQRPAAKCGNTVYRALSLHLPSSLETPFLRLMKPGPPGRSKQTHRSMLRLQRISLEPPASHHWQPLTECCLSELHQETVQSAGNHYTASERNNLRPAGRDLPFIMVHPKTPLRSILSDASPPA